MSECTRSRDLFGAYWDDETTQAEREWLEGHFSRCADCRESYEQLARTIEAVASLPREEAAPDLAARALAAARRMSPEPDRIFVRETPAWIPTTAAAAAVLLVLFTIVPMLTQQRPAGTVAQSNPAPVAEPRLVTPVGQPVAAVTLPSKAESLAIDHSADVDFVLDGLAVRSNRVHRVEQLPNGVRAEQAVISY